MTESRWRTAVVVLAAACLMPAAGRALDCVGACHNPDLVGVTDLVRGVEIALGNVALGECPAFDGNGDQQVTVDELLLGVRNALEGCGPHFNANQCDQAPAILPVMVGVGAVVSTNKASREAADPVLSCGCASSPRTVWATYDAAADGLMHVRAATRSTGQTLAVFSGDCGAVSELTCVPLDAEQVVVEVPATAGTHYLVEVSGACDGGGGVVSLGADICGDAITSGGEECDDGNAMAGDGCDAQCAFEDIGVIDSSAGACDEGGSINLFVAPIGQLFIPTVSALAGVDLRFSIQHDSQPQPVTLRLRRGSVDGEVLAEQSITTSATAGTAFYHFRFPSAVSVEPGQTYVLEVSTAGDNVSWIRSRGTELCPLAYPGGGGFAGGSRLNGEDLAFRTYAALS